MKIPETPVARHDLDAAGLGARYRRLALISHPRHLDSIAVEDGETLIVACDWLLWQRCIARGLDCVHYEAGLTGEDPDDLMSELYIRGNDWVYAGGKDATLFHGISLGRKMFKQTSLILFDCCKLEQTLRTLIARFSPDEILFCDYRTEYVFLDVEGRHEIVSAVAADLGVRVIDQRDAPDQSDPNLSLVGYGAALDHSADRAGRLRQRASRMFEHLMQAVSGLRGLIGRSGPKVLLLNSHLSMVPLLRAACAAASGATAGVKGRPMVLAAHFPRKRDIGFVWRNLVAGVRWIVWPEVRLTREEEAQIAAMATRLRDVWATDDADRATRQVRRYVLDQLTGSDRLKELALVVKAVERILARTKPDRVLTDALQNPIYSTFLQCAHQRGIHTTATWHGQHIQDMKLEIFGEDSRVDAPIDDCFTWGRAQEAWLRSTGARVPAIRTGNPISGQHFGQHARAGRKGRVLLLQYTAVLQDLHAAQEQQFAFFVDSVRMLNELGYRDICVRLHPGHAKTSYYRQIAELFGLECELSDSGPFLDVLRDAELAIGPVHSGAMLEVLSAEKPYYPVLIEPHSMNMRYLGGSPVFHNIGALKEALSAKSAIDQRGLLNNFTGFDEFADPARTMWDALFDPAPAYSFVPE